MAGLYAKKKGGDQVVSSVGGQNVPAVDAYIAGYEAGAKKANPGVKSIFAYSQDFVDQAKCKEIALNQIDQGSQVVFAVAGQCGLGALDAAKEKNVQSIGVDADQGYVNANVMTSALKKVDVAVFDTAKDIQDGKFKAGTDTVFDLKSGAVGLGKVNAAGQPFEADVKKVAGPDQVSARSPTSRRRWASSRERHRDPARARAARGHQAIRRGRRERPRRLRPAQGRGPRPAGGERGGQVDADERPLRALPARRGRAPARRRSR